MGKKLTFEEFEEKSIIIHKNKYKYFIYLGNEINIPIFCDKEEHGIFWQKPNHHLRGQGCKKCGLDVSKVISFNKRHTTEKFIRMAIEIHKEKYDYTLVSYTNATTKVKIICQNHGEFEQTPNAHLSGKGCFECGFSHKLTFDTFKIKAIKIHGNRYDYSEYIDSKTEIPIICKTHGIFFKTPDKHLNQMCGCPFCHESKGESIIRNFLIDNNINFIRQKRFSNCKYKNVLPFDFYLPEQNICIEYDGEQHFKPLEYFGGKESLEYTQKNDKIKTEYCKSNNIKFIRIPYWDFKNIKVLLNQKLGT